MKRLAFAVLAVAGVSVLLMGRIVFAQAAPVAQAPPAAPAAPAKPKTPSQAYLDYVAAVQKAKTLDEVLPLLSKQYRTNLQTVPKPNQPIWLNRIKEAADYSNLKVTKETITGEKAVLDATGTNKDLKPMKGKITMVKEGTDWKFDEVFWTLNAGA